MPEFSAETHYKLTLQAIADMKKTSVHNYEEAFTLVLAMARAALEIEAKLKERAVIGTQA